MNRFSLTIVLVALLVCSFGSQISIVTPEMSQPKNAREYIIAVTAYQSDGLHATEIKQINIITCIHVHPSTKTVAAGDTFAVNITITDVVDVYSWQFKLYYKKILTCTSVTEGEFLKRNGNSTFWPGANINNNYNSTHGRIMVSCSRTGAVPGETGSGVLATITFKALSAGNTTLHLFDTGLWDPPGVGAKPISHITIDGQVTVILNNPPSATNPKITPSIPTTSNNLVGSYTYSDPDGDPESGTEIKWYKNGVHQPVSDNQLIIPSSATIVGEEWYFKVTPKDGIDFGTQVESAHVVIVQKPELKMSPAAVTCRKFCEHFTVQINLSNAFNVEDFKFEIHYNATLLDYVSVTWNAWGTGSVDSSTGGVLIGFTSGAPTTGNLTLVTIEFHAAYHHVWKDCPSWTNYLTGTIYFKWANLSYPDSPDLRYEKSGINQIIVNQVNYTFTPIQGDVNNDGSVSMLDISLVAGYYEQDYAVYDLNCDGTIDIFDLVIVASNLWYEYNS